MTRSRTLALTTLARVEGTAWSGQTPPFTAAATPGGKVSYRLKVCLTQVRLTHQTTVFQLNTRSKVLNQLNTFLDTSNLT